MDNASAQPSAQQVIRAAIAAAGGVTKVGQAFGLTHVATGGWIERGRVPAERIKPLCEMGGGVISPDQILDAMTREANARAAA